MDTWWGKMLCGGLLLIFAGLLYAHFSARESGQTKQPIVRTSSDTLFELGGKWAVVAVPVLAGVGMLGWGTVHLARGKE